MKSNVLRAVLLAVPMFVAACGGGGGGGSGGGGSSPTATAPWTTATPVAVTTGNSQALAAEALALATSSDATDAADAGGLLTGVQVIAAGGTGGNGPLRLADAARKLLAKAQGTGTQATGVAQSVACTYGGTVTVDGASSGSGILTAGDWTQMTASNCTEGDGVTNVVMNGSMRISIEAGSYDPASMVYPKSVTMRVVATNFTVSGGGESETLNIDMTMTLTETSASTGSVAVTVNAMTSEIGTHTVFLTDYTLSVTEGASSSTISITASVQTNNSALGSSPVSYSITTLTPLTVSSTGVVTAGSIKVTGAGSALLLTVTASDTFSLQVDTNGDGTYDTTSTVTRSQLQALV